MKPYSKARYGVAIIARVQIVSIALLAYAFVGGSHAFSEPQAVSFSRLAEELRYERVEKIILDGDTIEIFLDDGQRLSAHVWALVLRDHIEVRSQSWTAP